MVLGLTGLGGPKYEYYSAALKELREMEQCDDYSGDVLEFLETLAPRYMKMDWDHGVSCAAGRAGRSGGFWWPWTLFRMYVPGGGGLGAELLVTHHPLIFQPPQSITDDTSVGRCILFLAARDMAAINAHTWTVLPGGQRLPGRALGLEETVVLESLRHRRPGAALGPAPCRTAGAGFPGGLPGAGKAALGLPRPAVCLRRPSGVPGGGGRRAAATGFGRPLTPAATPL